MNHKKYKTRPYRDKKWLAKKYIDEKLSTLKIAKLCNTDNVTIWTWLKKYNIKTRTYSEASNQLKGKESPFYKGSRRRNGYKYLFEPNHPYCNHRGYVAEHRLVVEKAMGRYLKNMYYEVVHHINGTKDDNRNCNLLVCSPGYHSYIERKMALLYKRMVFGGTATLA